MTNMRPCFLNVKLRDLHFKNIFKKIGAMETCQNMDLKIKSLKKCSNNDKKKFLLFFKKSTNNYLLKSENRFKKSFTSQKLWIFEKVVFRHVKTSASWQFFLKNRFFPAYWGPNKQLCKKLEFWPKFFISSHCAWLSIAPLSRCLLLEMIITNHSNVINKSKYVRDAERCHKVTNSSLCRCPVEYLQSPIIVNKVN